MKRMLRTLLCLLLPGLVPLAVQAQQAGIQCADPGASMLWEVGGEGMEQRGVRIHLFGSIHVGKPEFYPLHDRLETLFRDADHLVFEVDPGGASDPATAVQLQLRGMLPAGQTLDQVLSEETFAALERVMADMGLPLRNFMGFKPWMVALVLTNLQAGALGYNPQNGLELYFMNGKSPDSEILELESLQQQLAMLEALDPEIFLGYSLREFEKNENTIETMMRAWRCADKQTLLDLVSNSDELMQQADAGDREKIERMFDSLFTERNRTMADGVGDFASAGQGSYFVVVGAAHLLGENSVVELLRERGYRVSPVRLAP